MHPGEEMMRTWNMYLIHSLENYMTTYFLRYRYFVNGEVPLTFGGTIEDFDFAIIESSHSTDDAAAATNDDDNDDDDAAATTTANRKYDSCIDVYSSDDSLDDNSGDEETMFDATRAAHRKRVGKQIFFVDGNNRQFEEKITRTGS